MKLDLHLLRHSRQKFTQGLPLPDAHANTAYLKVQRCQEEHLTPREKRCLEPAKLPEAAMSDDNPGPTKRYKEKKQERMAMRASAGTKKLAYHKGVKSIMGSAAVVEGHHSRAKWVLTPERSTMSPLIFEAIVYLKMNKRLWGKAQVVKAIKRRKQAIKPRNHNLKEDAKKTLASISEWEEAQI